MVLAHFTFTVQHGCPTPVRLSGGGEGVLYHLHDDQQKPGELSLPDNNSHDIYITVVLSQQWFGLLGDIWQCLRTFLVVTREGPCGRGDSPTGTWWVEARNVAPHPTVHRTDPTQQGIIQPKMSIVLTKNLLYWCCSKYFTYSYIHSFNPTLGERYHYHPHFSDEETEARRNEVTCPNPHS